MTVLWHVSSSRNRASILEHGLDVSFMGAARGIAGSSRPEATGVFLCREQHEVDYFVDMNNTHGPVDVWAVADVDVDAMVGNGAGYDYLPGTVAASRLTLLRADVPQVERSWHEPSTDGAYRSTLTVRFDDGRALTGEEARAVIDPEGQ